MSNSAEITTARMLRDEEELEGALLPVASQIGGPSGATVSAAPIGRFEYGSLAEVEEGEGQQEQVAYAIPQASRDAIADDSMPAVKRAEVKGLIAAETEKEAIGKGERRIFAKNYYTQQAVENANRIARDRDGQGLQLPETSCSLPTLVDGPSETPTQKSGYKVGGYEVNEYQFGNDYETQDYAISEYKSVYD